MNETSRPSRTPLVALVLATVVWIACESPLAPEACGTVADQTIVVGETVNLDLCFQDPNGETLDFVVFSSDPSVATVLGMGSTVAVTAVYPGIALVTMVATDPTGLREQQSFWVTVPDRPPNTVATIDDRELIVGDSAAIDVVGYFSEPDGQALSYSAAVSDSNRVAVSMEGTVVTLVAVAKGTVVVTVTATDTGGLMASQPFRVTVPNRPPVAVDSIAAREIMVGHADTLDLSPFFSDPDEDPLVYEAAVSDGEVVGAAVSGSDLTVTGLARGEAMVTVTATDDEGLFATQSFLVTVPNQPPVVADMIPARTIFRNEADTVALARYFSDPDGDPLTWDAEASDAGVVALDLAGSEGTLVVTALSQGEAVVTVTVTDPDGLAAEQSFRVTVPNRPPVVTDTIPARTVFKGEADTVELAAYFSDPDDDPLTWDAEASAGSVVALDLAGSEGTLVVTALSQGEAVVTVTVTDPGGLSARQSFAVTVLNRAPIVTTPIPARTIFRSQPQTLDLDAHFGDPDGDTLRYSAVSTDQSVVRVRTSGSSLTLSARGRGAVEVTVTASDPDSLSIQHAFAVSVGNRGPVPVGSFPDLELGEGDSLTLPADGYFRDPDEDALTYTASTSDPGIATVTMRGATLQVQGQGPGTATITVLASDPGGQTAVQRFRVTVTRIGTGFHISLGFADNVTAALEDAVYDAGTYWMSILSDTEFADLNLNDTYSCRISGTRFDVDIGSLDDLAIVTAMVDIDGAGGTLAIAGTCVRRIATGTPVLGAMVFDRADVGSLAGSGDLSETALHEIAHVLGFGLASNWDDLVRDSVPGIPGADPHFAGAGAIAAFDAAGGTGYTGGKVPVTEDGAHWRESVLGLELMTPAIRSGVLDPLSAITIRALADMGYQVNTGLAQSFVLASPDAAVAVADEARTINLGDDVYRGSVTVIDNEGKVVRVVPGTTEPETGLRPGGASARADSAIRITIGSRR